MKSVCSSFSLHQFSTAACWATSCCRSIWARYKGLETALTKHSWQDFLAGCSHIDASVLTWSESTQLKLFQVILRILAEAKYLDSVRNLRLTPQSVHPEVRRYLMRQEDRYALHCMDIAK